MKAADNSHSQKNKIPCKSLHHLGWSDFFEAQVNSEIPSARVVGMRKNCFLVNDGETEILTTVAGNLINNPDKIYPAVGDWVQLRDTVIHSVLERKNVLSRQITGRRSRKSAHPATSEQIIAANLDTTFIVCGLDRDFNLRRIERYLTMIYNAGITPTIILTKADLHENPAEYVLEVEQIAFGVPIHLVSANNNMPLEELKPYLAEGQTVALVGSSGVGKSTLINRLYGKQIQSTGKVSDSLGKGKHTTTNRDLILLPSGGMVIDNPGIREVGLTLERSSEQTAFPEIEQLALSCKFPDCTHSHEPGCQIQDALAKGEISEERLHSYNKLIKEQAYHSQRESKGVAGAEKERWKGVSMKIKNINKNRRKR